MTCNITAAPLDVEPLPLYQPDPETSSLLSSAPSYTSEAPTYRSSEQQQPQPYYITTSLLDISTPPPRTRIANPPRRAAAANNDDNARPTSPRSTTGLPAATTYAPGFTSRAAVPDAPDALLLQSNYNIGAWSSVTHGHARRQYERVAMRRASRAAGNGRTTALVESMKMGGENPPVPNSGGGTPGSSRAATPPPPLPSSPAEGLVGGGGDGSAGVDVGESGSRLVASAAADVAASPSTASIALAEPVLPLEDPALVGEAAAKRARQQRLYREACLRHEDNTRLAQESKSWDFMLSQMADWEERERSWGRFRADLEARQGRIGAMGVGIGRLGGFAIGDGGRAGGRRWRLASR